MAKDDRKILDELRSIRARFAEIGESMSTNLRELTFRILSMENKMALLDQLAAEVAENTSVVQSVTTLVTGLRDKVLALQAQAQAAGDSPETIAKIHELAAQLDANTNTLAALTVENTPAPAEPAAPSEPVVPATPEEPAPAEPAPTPEADPAAPVETQPAEQPPADTGSGQ